MRYHRYDDNELASDDLIVVVTRVVGADGPDLIEICLPVWDEVVLRVVAAVQLDDGVNLAGGVGVFLVEHKVDSHHAQDKQGD